MGKVINGVNGPVSGKIGNVVFCKWKGIDYIRSLPRLKKNRKPTASQAKQRSKFRFMQDMLSYMVPLVRLGFMNYAPNRTGHNSAMSYNLKEAVLQDDAGYKLHYEKFSFSKGSLPAPKDVKITLEGNILRFSWADAKDEKELDNEFNHTMLLLYPEDRRHLAHTKQFGNYRHQEEDTLDVANLAGKEAKFHAYIAFFASDGSNNSSDSVYAGVIEIP